MLSNPRIENLKTKLSDMFGVNIDITIRGEKAFTFSFEGENKGIADKIILFFGKYNLIYDYDLECDMTCLYLDI